MKKSEVDTKSNETPRKKRKSAVTETTNPEETMFEVRKMKDLMQDKDDVVLDSILAEGVTEVKDLSTDLVSQKIEELVINIVRQILETGTFDLSVPNRSESNQIYIESVDRNVLGNKVHID